MIIADPKIAFQLTELDDRGVIEVLECRIVLWCSPKKLMKTTRFSWRRSTAVGCTCSVIGMVLRECDIMSEVAHPHVVRFLGKLETPTCLYLVLELVVGGELFDYLLKTGRQTEDQARKLFRQLISAVHYCHERNVW